MTKSSCGLMKAIGAWYKIFARLETCPAARLVSRRAKIFIAMSTTDGFVDLVTVLEQSGSQMDPFLSDSECFPSANQKIETCSHHIGIQTFA